MDRLQKKCVIGSGIMHGSLVVLLLVGPAFLGSNDKPLDPKDIIDFIPYQTFDKNVAGGGNPNVPKDAVLPPPATQQTPVVQPPKQTLVQPDPQKREPATEIRPERNSSPKSDPDSLEPGGVKLSKDNLKRVVRPSKNAGADRNAAQRDNRDFQKQLGSVTAAIRSGVSSGTVSVELRGPGGGGTPYAGFDQALVNAYMRAWIAPAKSAESGAIVVAVVTLRRDGTVISSRIGRPSGNAELDASVETALRKVPYVAPFPASTKDEQKTFWLEFDPKRKQMMG